MITLKDSIEIKATPERVFKCLIQRFQSKENYQAWHPEHVDIRWIKGEPLKEGSVIYAEEYLHGHLHKLKFRVTKMVRNKEIKYRALLPFLLLAPENAFIIEPKGKGNSIFTATGLFRGGPLFEKFWKNQIEATKRHMKEEGENLKLALEKGKD